MARQLIAGFVLLAGVVALGAVAVGFGDTPSDTIDTAGDTTSAPTIETDATPSTTTTAAPIIEPENFGPRKDLVNLDGWLNTDAASIDDFDGKVLVVEMWTFGCFNCKARIPYNQELYAAHSRDDFEIIGVHAPEFAHEAEIPNIEEAIERLGVTWPVALDTNKENFRAWQSGGRRFWPRTYVIDQNGDVRYDHIGEGRYQELADTVEFLIDNPPITAS